MTNDLLTVLHLSDFHFSKRKSREQKIVVDALITDLEALCIGHRRPDLILFTGDLVGGGGTDSHADAYDWLLARVMKATSCSDERMFLAPGNHDLSRDYVIATEAEHREWRSSANDMDRINEVFAAGGFDEAARAKFSDYADLESYLSEDTLHLRNAFVSVHRVEHLNIDIVVVNTAMFSVGGLDHFEKDEKMLAVPEYALLEAEAALQPNSFRIYMTHHPFDMLSEAGARMLRASIEANGNLHLFGHMHDPDSRNTVGFRGEIFSDQAGAVFTHRKLAYIGYSLISVERGTGHYETHLRSYFNDRRAFDEAVDIVPNGRFYPSHEARQYWRKIATPVDPTALASHLAGAGLTAFEAELFASEADRETHEKFVAPPMRRNVVRTAVEDDEGRSSDEPPVAFDELVREDANVILYAPAEYGRTTVLKEVACQLFKEASTLRLPRLPVFIDFCDVKQNLGHLVKTVRGRAADVPDGMDFESLLKLGHVCLLFDDVDFADAKRVGILRDFVSNYPKARYIFSCAKNSVATYGAQINPEMPIHFDLVELCVLRRKDMRMLVVKHNTCTDVDTVLDRLQSEFQEIGLPFTAANGSVLMAIYEEQSNFRPINRSVLIEQFIDTSLRKAALEQSRRETFDYANKTALLAHVAAEMAKADDYLPRREFLRGTMKAYLERLGLNVSIDELIIDFFAARVFVQKPDDRVSFRYRAVLEYFIALQMSVDPVFRAWVLEENRYLQFINEIQYYAGKLRNDASLVDEIGRRFEETVKELEADSRPFDLHQLASFRLPRNDSELTDDLLESYLNEPLTQDERDEELEADLPQDVEHRQEVFRPSIDGLGQKLVVSLLLYSGVLKNMELIDDVQKRRHLNVLWRGWSIFWLVSLMIVPDIARLRRFRLNGILYDINAPHGMADSELARIIALNMPTGVSKILAASLGTEKLERQLTEPDLSTSGEPLAYEFLRSALVSDLKLSATPGTLKVALERLRASPYMSEALIWKIGEMRRLDRISATHLDELMAPLATAIANLKGGTAKSRGNEKRRQIQRIQRASLVLRMKRNSSKD